jgi:uncharacterized protein YkwD
MLMELAFVMAVGLAGDEPVAESNAQPAVKQELELTGAEANVLELTNKERVSRGLPPLTIDESLVESARQHAFWMASRRTMQHTSKPVGENIAMGQNNSNEAVRTWMNSSGHRANILSRSWNRVGAAAYTSPEGRIYWCLQFLR